MEKLIDDSADFEITPAALSRASYFILQALAAELIRSGHLPKARFLDGLTLMAGAALREGDQRVAQLLQGFGRDLLDEPPPNAE